MIHLRRSALLLLHVLLLVLITLPTGRASAQAAEAPAADSCRADQLSEAKVKASAKFDHRGSDYSVLTSTMELRIPAGWAYASDLLLDTRSGHYRFALRCLLGKVSPDSVYDYEWRLKPVGVGADGKWVTVHYEAVAWVQALGEYRAGPWQLNAGKNEWTVQLRPPANLAAATWEDVHVHLGGPGAMSATPPPTFGEAGTVLRWQSKRRTPIIRAEFRPPPAQQWYAISATDEEFWEALGSYSASGAFYYVAASALLIISARRLRRSLGRNVVPKEDRTLKVVMSWALLQALIGLTVYMGDNIYRLLSHRLSWSHDYEPVFLLFSLMFFGVALCFFGRVGKRLLVFVCAFFLCAAGLYFGVELSELDLLPNSDVTLSPAGSWVSALVYLVVIFACFLGLVSAGQRVLFMGDRSLPQWLVVSVSLLASASTLLWAYLAFDRSWERVSWLADPEWPQYWPEWATFRDGWWWYLPYTALVSLADLGLFLTPLALLGVLRVCRAEQHQDDSFTPNQAEKLLLVLFFVIAVLPGYAVYFGFSGYVLTLIIGFVSVWGVLALGYSKSVLEQPAADNAPLGKVISRTDRSEMLRLARHFRELQSRLQRLNTSNSPESSRVQESIEREIDQLDRSLPEGVRPVDLPFAFGPMSTWWGNACRSALIACFFGLPATALMYWTDLVQNESWIVITQNDSGFISIVAEILYWHTTWVAGGFFLGALWRDLPGRHGPTKAFCVGVAFVIPVVAHQIIAQAIGQSVQGASTAIAAFVSVMTLTGFAMDVQTFQSERRYWPTNANLVAYVYQMRFASVAFFLAQLLALATIWKTLREGGPMAPPPR
ncbi:MULTISPECIES: DUF6185 family protein [unclassified Streptomyces]|uniref:DUF6185 family protein n=1 Tax=unclassified Streptomyces TaxID=2593676 RepID=UPI001BEBE496|nr:MULTISPECIES: DUF6185 family protein [unclassified Streptomyces]MBT2407291.1 hypothetical protein [Streptomyces sp. ISL-21]MBT2613412.1 hypothetical protein [Streptomyces sp. ISL-87]